MFNQSDILLAVKKKHGNHMTVAERASSGGKASLVALEKAARDPIVL